MGNKHRLVMLTALFLVVSAGVYYMYVSSVAGATYTWDGGGVTDSWTECANWSSDTCPGSSDIAYFDGTCVTNCSPSVQSNFSVAGLTMAAGYTGTITIATSSPTVGLSGFSQAAGTFQGGTGTTTYTRGNFTISGGTYNAASTTYFLSQDNGVVTINVPTSQTFGSVTFYELENGSKDIQITSGDTLIALGTTTFARGFVMGGTIDARGNIVTQSTSYGGSTWVDLGNDSLAQTWNVYGGSSPSVRFDSAADASDSIVLFADALFYGASTTASFSGTIPFVPNNYTVSFFTNGWVQAAGTYQGGTGTTSIYAGSFTLTGGTYNAASTTYFQSQDNGMVYINVPTSQTFHNLRFYELSNGSHDIQITTGDTLIALGTTTFVSGYLDGGTVDMRGNAVTESSATGGTTIVDLGNDSLAQIWRINGGTVLTARFDSSGDASDQVLLAANATFYGATTTSSFSGTIPIVMGSYNMTITTNGWYQAAGTFQGGTGTTTVYEGNFYITGGTYNAASTTYFSSDSNASISIDVPTSVVFESLKLRELDNGGHNIVLASGDTLIVLATTTFMDGYVDGGTGIEARGNVVVESAFNGGTTPLLFTGSSTSGRANQTFNLTGATGLYDADITINKSEGTVTLSSALVMDASSQDLTVTRGTLDLAGQNLTVSGSGGVFTVASGATLSLQGGETVTASPALASGSTVTYTGTGTYTKLVLGASYSNLSFTGSGSWATSSALTIGGNFTQTAGTFTHTGTTTFTGTSVTLTPSAGTSFQHVAVSPSTIPSDLMAWWKFDEGSGSSAADSSGNGKTGTLTNMEAADWSTTDKPTLSYTNSASIGTNANDEYISTAGVDIGTAWSITSWFKWPLESTGSWNTLTRASAGGGNHQIIVQRSNNHLGAYVGAFYSSNYDMDVLSNGWHHLAAVASSSGSGTAYYIDGVYVGTAGAKSTDDVTYLGNYQGGSQQWGMFDDLRVYSSALTASQVSSVAGGSGFSAEGTVTLAGNLTLTGNLYISASSTLDASAAGCSSSSCNISVAGNWINSGGTFVPRTGTVTLSGTNQSITGSTTFYNLTKTVSASSTLTYEAGSTQTIQGAWTMRGSGAGTLSLRSSTPGSYWYVDPQGTRSVAYLDVQDGNNTNARSVNMTGTGNVDSGHNENFNWTGDPEARFIRIKGGVRLMGGVRL